MLRPHPFTKQQILTVKLISAGCYTLPNNCLQDVLLCTVQPLYANWMTKYVKVREKRNSGRSMQRPLIDNLTVIFDAIGAIFSLLSCNCCMLSV